jgi:hypothetical protein
MSEAQLETMQ